MWRTLHLRLTGLSQAFLPWLQRRSTECKHIPPAAVLLGVNLSYANLSYFLTPVVGGRGRGAASPPACEHVLGTVLPLVECQRHVPNVPITTRENRWNGRVTDGNAEALSEAAC